MTESRQTRAVVSRRAFVAMAAGAVATGAAAMSGCALTDQSTETFTSKYRAGKLPVDAPEDGDWLSLPWFEAKLQPQKVAQPMLALASIPTLKVRSLHNGEQIAFHLEWADRDDDHIEAVARFRDAVAVQLPTTPEAPAISMGQPGSPVHIMLWRASWQVDVDEGRQTVEDAFPNFHAGPRPEGLMLAQDAKVFYPGVFVGNPLSTRSLTTPIEELTAIGFGSLTTLDSQDAVGRGVHGGGQWRVVMATAMKGGEGRADLTAGRRTKVAFAAWSGGERNRGARKQFADWTDVRIEGPAL